MSFTHCPNCGEPWSSHTTVCKPEHVRSLAPVEGSARSRFEAWITAPPIERGVERWLDDETRYAWPRQYRDTAVQLAWESWCEAMGQDPFTCDNHA